MPQLQLPARITLKYKLQSSQLCGTELFTRKGVSVCLPLYS